jgi:hypothetical protein
MATFAVEQVIAAGAFWGRSQRDLGDASDLSFESVRDFEHDEPSATTKSAPIGPFGRREVLLGGSR